MERVKSRIFWIAGTITTPVGIIVTPTSRNREYEFEVGSQTFRALLTQGPLRLRSDTVRLLFVNVSGSSQTYKFERRGEVLPPNAGCGSGVKSSPGLMN
jgi:hypothetical protein